MVKSPDRGGVFARFCASFEDCGLVVLGGLELGSSDCPAGFEELAGHTALLIGNHGSQMWEHFSASAEYGDGQPNALDRWTVQVLEDVAVRTVCSIFHPSHKPYWPFQRLASRVMGVKVSPLGLLVHPEFGLWHGLRGLLVFEPAHEFTSQIKGMALQAEEQNHPCDACVDKPCLGACPVGAFGDGTLDVARCFTHIDSGSEPDCMKLGCRARDACPVGLHHRNRSEQIEFHMRSYRGR